MKRVALFLVTNLAVLVLLSAVIRLFGLDAAPARQGIDLTSLLVMAAVVGFAGSFISLAMSKWFAKHRSCARLFIESVLALTKDAPLTALRLPLWWSRGRAVVKRAVARRSRRARRVARATRNSRSATARANRADALAACSSGSGFY